MPAVLGMLEDSLYTSFNEPDPVKRRAALDAWIEETTLALQAAFAEEMKTLVEFANGRWTEEGGILGLESKVRSKQGEYALVMRISLRPLGPQDPYQGWYFPAVPRPEQPGNRESGQTKLGEGYASDEADDYSEGGRSPNDDRSDSMNPNNPAYDAAMDNRSNQLNPNNQAYHSSRGGGKGR
ncbi:MAG: hypothetical protein HY687_02830 [Chloroflexi bacterium]|nr:hypothetical protein [Chloroflexota bacterium]